MNRQRGKQVKPLSPGKVAKVTKPGRYADGGGLYLWVKPDGRKTWTYRWRDRVTGGQREAGLGSLTNQRVTLKQARDRADKYRDMVWSGLDPIAERKRLLEVARAEQAKLWTFQQCAEAYIETNKAQWKNPKHTAQWTSTLTTYASPIWTMLVRDIEQDEVLSCIEPHWTTKTETMTRVRQRIEAVLAWAKVKKYRTGDNPAQWKNHLDKVLPKPTQLKKVVHRAALPWREAGAFMATLRDVDSMAAKALELQILTATRPGETVGARWTEIDLEAKVWTIPAERMKADKEHEIPLSTQALKLIKSLPHVSDFLFPGVSLDKPMTTAAAMKLIKRIHPGITAHGFRSTFRDWCADDQTAYPREVIEHALAHQLKDKAEASYQRSTVFPKRVKLMTAWANYCDTISTDANNVRQIRGVKS
jgi:integrase